MNCLTKARLIGPLEIPKLLKLATLNTYTIFTIEFLKLYYLYYFDYFIDGLTLLSLVDGWMSVMLVAKQGLGLNL